jgi:hypothetical protein
MGMDTCVNRSSLVLLFLRVFNRAGNDHVKLGFDLLPYSELVAVFAYCDVTLLAFILENSLKVVAGYAGFRCCLLPICVCVCMYVRVCVCIVLCLRIFLRWLDFFFR